MKFHSQLDLDNSAVWFDILQYKYSDIEWMILKVSGNVLQYVQSVQANKSYSEWRCFVIDVSRNVKNKK